MKEAPPLPSPTSTSSEREILPQNLKPIHYDLKFEPELVNAAEFIGSSTIHVSVLEDTTSITLNSADLSILKTEIISSNGQVIEILDLQYDEAKERVVIPFKNALVPAGQSLKIKQIFKGSLLHNSNAFFRSPIDMPHKTTKWMASTQLEPTHARKVFPCFDEPALKATFSITIVAQKHMTCLSNMDVASEVDVLSNSTMKKAVKFHTTPVMSTYIVCLAVGDLKFIETNSFRVPIRVYATSDKNIEHGRFALEHASRAMKIFERIFDIEYPLPKLDLIAIPAGQGAMENWGLVTFGDKYLLVNEDETSAEAFRSAGSVVVHELAHQWFGNIVTMEFWDGLWLNESFADWAELYVWETLDPSWKMWQNFTIDGYMNALLLDSNKASHPIEMPVKKAAEINQIFDSISYDKGCGVLRMIAGFIGVDVFVKGVQYYLKKHAFGNATTSDLWDALAVASGQNVRGIMEAWTRNMGYPVVVVSESNGSIAVSQHRFLQDGSRLEKDDKILFPLSLRLRTATSVDEDFKLYERNTKYTIKKDFILNADRYGFYRIAYTPERLQILGESVKNGFLSPEDKVGLISDTLALASANFENQKTSSLLSLLENFDEESNFFVWSQIASALEAIQSAWSCEKDSVIQALKNFEARLVSKMLASKGWEFKKGEDKVETMFKALFFTLSGDNPEVQKAAFDMFEAFVLQDDEKAININIENAVFKFVLENGGVQEVCECSPLPTSIHY